MRKILLFLVKNQGADQVKKFYELDLESSSIASEYSKDKQIQSLALTIKTEHQWMYQNPSAASAQREEALNFAQSIKKDKLPCVIGTPFGLPVLPDVNII